MSANDETIYIKIDQNVLVSDSSVTIGDVASVTSSNEAMVRQVRQIKFFQFPEKSVNGKKLPKVQRKVFSILKIVELIHKDYPTAEISNEGETDFVLEYKQGENSKVMECAKTVLLSILIFFGAAFTIMSFNNDIAITELFEKFYLQIAEVESNGLTELEISYCIGVTVGILVFFNHVGKKKLTPDPTPIQVQLRKYEQDVDTTFIENSGRGGTEVDVD